MACDLKELQYYWEIDNMKHIEQHFKEYNQNTKLLERIRTMHSIYKKANGKCRPCLGKDSGKRFKEMMTCSDFRKLSGIWA